MASDTVPHTFTLTSDVMSEMQPARHWQRSSCEMGDRTRLLRKRVGILFVVSQSVPYLRRHECKQFLPIDAHEAVQRPLRIAQKHASNLVLNLGQKEFRAASQIEL